MRVNFKKCPEGNKEKHQVLVGSIFDMTRRLRQIIEEDAPDRGRSVAEEKLKLRYKWP